MFIVDHSRIKYANHAVFLHFVMYRLVTIVSVYGSHEDNFDDCQDGNLLQAFYVGMMILLAFKAVVNVFLIYHSSRVRIGQSLIILMATQWLKL